jgi:hypothetical protein
MRKCWMINTCSMVRKFTLHTCILLNTDKCEMDTPSIASFLLQEHPGLKALQHVIKNGQEFSKLKPSSLCISNIHPSWVNYVKTCLSIKLRK